MSKRMSTTFLEFNVKRLEKNSTWCYPTSWKVGNILKRYRCIVDVLVRYLCRPHQLNTYCKFAQLFSKLIDALFLFENALIIKHNSYTCEFIF